jgi:hypothetical protein
MSEVIGIADKLKKDVDGASNASNANEVDEQRGT